MTASTYSGPTALCAHSMDLMATGGLEDFERVFHPQAVNREAATEPPAARQPGPAGFYATAQWLRAAFSGLRFEIHQAIEHDDLVAFHVTMSGRHTGDFITYQPDTTQTHWFRTRDGMITEHWANRDDLAMARQAGWIPPSPRFLLRAALARRRAQKRSA
jgi:hypothetical protein